MALLPFIDNRNPDVDLQAHAEGRAAAGCPNCQHTQTAIRYDFGRERILRCTGCGLMYLYPWPTEEETRAVYGDTYFQNGEFLKGENSSLFGYVDYIAERLNKQWQYARIARDIQARLKYRNDRPRLLEVGCGFGYFLDVAFEEGFDVTGVEFNAFAVDRLRRKYAFPIISEGLEAATLEPRAFDVVTMFDVIEHLRDPFGAVDRLWSALVPGGLLVLSTQDAESWVSRLLGKRLEDFRRTREHLFFFGRQTLSQVLHQHGFDVVSIRSIGHTFSLTVLLERLALYNRPLFLTLRTLVIKAGLGSLQFHINPLTKMIVFASRRG
ncbi:MAG: class I SAM-dependent methyltransferase [Candidatus Binatia bacterium]